MSNILVINSGSTSVKYKLFDGDKEKKAGIFNDVKNHDQAIKQVLKDIGDLRDIRAVGHRVVHGGDKFCSPIIVDEDNINQLKEFNKLAPLHNPYNLAGIAAVAAFLPDVPQVAVFDTSFYADLPEVAYTYAIPQAVAEKFKIRRYGFHGISHKYATEEAARQLNKKPTEINLISCHMGGGWSVTAVKRGKAIDTSMGWTPLEGLVMMTRSGDIDPGIILELIKESAGRLGEEKAADVYNLLNKESGIIGLSGAQNFQDLLKKVSLGEADSKLAFDLAIYRLVKYIGSYIAVLEGQVDGIIFTGAIGAGNPMTRNRVMGKLKFLGNIPVLPIKADEELMIAREAGKLISNTVTKS